MNPINYGLLCGRKIEFFHHTSEKSWGYSEEQQDTFAVIHPKDEVPGKQYPLSVVFHSAGHDVYSCIATIWQWGNHDIYHVPDDMFGLFPDCRANSDKDWWWGGNPAYGDQKPELSGTAMQPVENRVTATIEWTMNAYPIDANRVYAVGNSMGGSGCLGYGLCRGDLFAGIKANVPAGIRHAADRCCLDTPAPDGFSIPDPPVVVDYSSQTDKWSTGHEIFYNTMREKQYAVLGFWGAFGHENNDWLIAKHNDLINAFPFYELKKNEAYPVFTNASTDDPMPWPDKLDSPDAGQINGYFRWETLEDTAERFSIRLKLLKQDEWETRVQLPTDAVTNLTLRRLQRFKLSAGEKFNWSYREAAGTGNADAEGKPTLEKIVVTADGAVLTLTK